MGLEQSFKISEKSLLRNRFLLGTSKGAIGQNCHEKMLDICVKMGMPEDFLESFRENLSEANYVHFGFEQNETLMTTEKGKIISQGRTSEIFAWEDGKVLKLFREGFSEDAEYEVIASKVAREAGLSVPVMEFLLESLSGKISAIASLFKPRDFHLVGADLYGWFCS